LGRGRLIYHFDGYRAEHHVRQGRAVAADEPAAFSDRSLAAKYAHDVTSFPFALGVLVLFLLRVGRNFPTKADVEWFNERGGMVGHQHARAFSG
jgi:hypothetical protein